MYYSRSPRSISKATMERKNDSKKSNGSKLTRKEPIRNDNETKKNKLKKPDRQPRSPKTPPSLPPKPTVVVEGANAITQDSCPDTSDPSNFRDGHKLAYMPIAAPESADSKIFKAEHNDDDGVVPCESV